MYTVYFIQINYFIYLFIKIRLIYVIIFCFITCFTYGVDNLSECVGLEKIGSVKPHTKTSMSSLIGKTSHEKSSFILFRTLEVSTHPWSWIQSNNFVRNNFTDSLICHQWNSLNFNGDLHRSQFLLGVGEWKYGLFGFK